jgi:hypothetical protein
LPKSLNKTISLSIFLAPGRAMNSIPI